MGVKFIEHMGGHRIYSCRNCGTSFTNVAMRKSADFRASSGVAYLFTKVVNVVYSDSDERSMLTGTHIVRDAICKKCNKTVGWMYEYAYRKDQKYKEGMVILERAHLTSAPGLRNE